MLHYLKEYNKYAEITGYKNTKFTKAEEFLKSNRKENRRNVDLQFFNAELIATQDHLYFAILNALQAFKNKINISKTIAMETMLYASAQRQIQKAIQRCGIKPETTSMAVVIIGEDSSQIEKVLNSVSAYVGVNPDDKVLEISQDKDKRIVETFDISEKEIQTITKNENRKEALVNLVIERVALLATQL